MILWYISSNNSYFMRKSLSRHFAWRHEVCSLYNFSRIKFSLRKPNFHVTSMNMKFNILARSLEILKCYLFFYVLVLDEKSEKIWKNLKKYESKGTLKIPISQFFNEKTKTWNHNPSKYSKIPIFNIFHVLGNIQNSS